MGTVERVQEVSLAFKDSIPPEFVRSEAEQPAITMLHGPVPRVPTVDFGALTEEEAVAAVAAASREWGMFQVVNHGIPDEVIRKLQTVGREFFGLPQVEKEVFARPAGAHGVEGYGTKLQKEVEGKKAWVDHLFHKIWPPSAINYQFWPKNPTSYREVNEEYAKLLREVADKVLQMLALGLGLESHEIREAIGGEKLEYMMKINYYPPCPRPDLALGVVAHTDASSLTILVPNEVQGLQAFKDDHWFDVNYIPNALVIHIGDQIEIISNGKYKSVLHRTTVDKEKTRMSWPVFLEPPADLPIGPNPKLIDDGNPPKYKTKKFGEYFHCKLNKLPQ